MPGSPTAIVLIFRAALKVRLQQRGRAAERVGDVVEPVRRVVRRKQRGDIDVQTEQIADRVRILRAVQPVQDRTARDSDARAGVASSSLSSVADQTIVGRRVGAARRQAAA